MGVCGCGKSTIGENLAAALGWPFYDADNFHPEANVTKMAAGQPLEDSDRWPWLDRIADEMRAVLARGGHAV
ncbi:MAG: shikimate kinase, partial [Casimicrobiaceae bacterium]